jgi:hypothetical protein
VGDFCARCADGYFTTAALLCEQCGPAWRTIVLTVAQVRALEKLVVMSLMLCSQFSFLILLVLVVILGSEALMNHAAFVLLSFRYSYALRFSLLYLFFFLLPSCWTLRSRYNRFLTRRTLQHSVGYHVPIGVRVT